MKIRFWQKTYLLTLSLFLLCLNLGILSLTVYTYGKNVEGAEAAAKAEQYYVAMNYQRDYEELMADNPETASPTLLMQAYGAYYGKKDLFIAFEQEGRTVYSNFKEPYSIDPDQLLHVNFDGKRHILISSAICDGKYELVFAKDVSALDTEFHSLMISYAATAVGVSVFLAVVLFFVLKKLSAPLEKLRRTTEAIQGGDYTVAAEERGNDEFTQLSRSFNSMLSTINKQMQTLELDAQKKQMLVDNLAHELRTPLTSIHGYAEFLEKAAASEERRVNAAKYIQSESERLQKISEILLDSACIRGYAPQMQEMEVSAVLMDVAQKLQSKAEKNGVNLRCVPSALTVMGNETLLSMLFYNLAENAVKASTAGGWVELAVSGDTVCVRDSGRGMTAEQLQHITEPFYRTDKSRSRAEGGAGLGLALCKQIVEIHGAELRFESQIGLGTEVFVRFTSSKQLRDKSETGHLYTTGVRR